MNPRNRKDGARGLVPVPADQPHLTRAQRTIRSHLAKVEPLRESIDTAEAELDATLSVYAAATVPRLCRQTALHKELVRALAPYRKKGIFPHKQDRFACR